LTLGQCTLTGTVRDPSPLSPWLRLWWVHTVKRMLCQAHTNTLCALQACTYKSLPTSMRSWVCTGVTVELTEQLALPFALQTVFLSPSKPLTSFAVATNIIVGWTEVVKIVIVTTLVTPTIMYVATANSLFWQRILRSRNDFMFTVSKSTNSFVGSTN